MTQRNMITNLNPILYAEDEETDAFFLKRAFKQAGIAHPLIIVPDGQEAIGYCSGERQESHRESPLPCLVLLDLNMPRKSGVDVLKWIRRESQVATVPVIILTSSLQEADIQRAYSNGANAYLVKPSQPEELVTMAKAIKDFWFAQNRTSIRRIESPEGE